VGSQPTRLLRTATSQPPKKADRKKKRILSRAETQRRGEGQDEDKQGKQETQNSSLVARRPHFPPSTLLFSASQRLCASQQSSLPSSSVRVHQWFLLFESAKLCGRRTGWRPEAVGRREFSTSHGSRVTRHKIQGTRRRTNRLTQSHEVKISHDPAPPSWLCGFVRDPAFARRIAATASRFTNPASRSFPLPFPACSPTLLPARHRGWTINELKTETGGSNAERSE
jgi:hypothetical protein